MDEENKIRTICREALEDNPHIKIFAIRNNYESNFVSGSSYTISRRRANNTHNIHNMFNALRFDQQFNNALDQALTNYQPTDTPLSDVKVSELKVITVGETCPICTDKTCTICVDEICSICFDKYSNGVIKLQCNHVFHEECIKKWFTTRSTCPLCRRDN